MCDVQLLSMSTATEIRQGKNPYSGNNGLSTTQGDVNGSWQLQRAMYVMTDWGSADLLGTE